MGSPGLKERKNTRVCAVGRGVACLALAMIPVWATACGRGQPLPEARPLLNRAADAMAEVETARFRLDVEGPPSELSIEEAEGQMTRGGELSAKAKVLQRGQLVEYDYIVAEGTAYLRGATGGFQALPRSFADRIYNPSRLLDDASGLRQTLTGARDPRTEAADTVEGVPAYRIKAKVNSAPVQGIYSLPPDQRWLDSTLWVEQGSRRLVKARIPISTGGSAEEIVFTVTLYDFNFPADIRAPQT